jgi:hypothetical protein
MLVLLLFDQLCESLLDEALSVEEHYVISYIVKPISLGPAILIANIFFTYVIWSTYYFNVEFSTMLEPCKVIDWLLTFSVGATPVCPASIVNRYLTSSAKFAPPVAVRSPNSALK